MKRMMIAAALLVSGPAPAQDALKEIDKPASELKQVLAQQVEIPAAAQEVRVVRATIEPRTAASWHRHPSPVYLYVVSGSLTLEVEGQDARTISGGEAMAEPLGAEMRAVNEGDVPVEVVVFQISPGEQKFLEPSAK